MTIAITGCGNNFLGQAQTMLQSLERQHPEIKTILFLVDNPDERIDYEFFAPAEVVVVDESVVKGFGAMVDRYAIVELNTAVRPSLIQYVQKRFPEARKFFYIDPDTFLYGKLETAEQLLETEDIIITPHFLRPLPMDGLRPFENLALNYGIYNMGFFGLNLQSENTHRMLDWWEQRMETLGHIDIANGYFTDQIWFNLVPVFFDKVHTIKDPGYNMAAWNLHERRIGSYESNGHILLDSGDPLIVYHFSSWNYNEPSVLSAVYNRYNFDNRPDLVKLYADYRLALQANRMEEFQRIPCTLPYYKAVDRRSRVKKMLTPGVNLMRNIWRKI